MNRQIVLIFVTLIIGIFLGWIFFHSSPPKNENHDITEEASKPSSWTCAMHPQIHMEKPGKCPICAMDLIPINQSNTVGMDPSALHLTKEALQLANVMTSVVTRQNPLKEVRLYGKVQADERLLQNQVAFVSGRVEKLLLNFTGESVRKGQPLALIYSPALVTAQQELLEAAKTREGQPEIYEASKEKLRQLKLSESQILAVENSGIVKSNIEVESTASGIVTARRVNTGDYVSQGTVLFEISDLSSVWVLFDAYESDLPFLKSGDKIEFTIQALPGSTFSGVIKFIDPVIDPVNRVAKVRLEIGNAGGKLKPEMFVTGIVKGDLDQYHDKLVIPRSAVLWTGKRSVVYVKQPGIGEPIFKMRSIELGPLIGNSFVVSDGLTDGEEIVTQGAFSIDASAQLEGKPSMMNQEENQSSTSISSKNQGEMKTTSNQKKVVHRQVLVYGNCDMCKDRIESVVKSISGVSSAGWNLKTKLLDVQFAEGITNMDIIQQKVAGAGHDTEKYTASEEGYKQLPSCCLYRKK